MRLRADLQRIRTAVNAQQRRVNLKTNFDRICRSATIDSYQFWSERDSNHLRRLTFTFTSANELEKLPSAAITHTPDHPPLGGFIERIFLLLVSPPPSHKVPAVAATSTGQRVLEGVRCGMDVRWSRPKTFQSQALCLSGDFSGDVVMTGQGSIRGFGSGGGLLPPGNLKLP